MDTKLIQFIKNKNAGKGPEKWFIQNLPSKMSRHKLVFGNIDWSMKSGTTRALDY